MFTCQNIIENASAYPDVYHFDGGISGAGRQASVRSSGPFWYPLLLRRWACGPSSPLLASALAGPLLITLACPRPDHYCPSTVLVVVLQVKCKTIRMPRLNYLWRSLLATVILLVLLRVVSVQPAVRDRAASLYGAQSLQIEHAETQEQSAAPSPLECVSEKEKGTALSRLPPASNASIEYQKKEHPNHYPSWDSYVHADYDPNRWQFLPK